MSRRREDEAHVRRRLSLSPETALQGASGIVQRNGETEAAAQIATMPDLSGYNQPGIYFLYDHGVVVYVGQAVNVRSRIATHLGEGLKHFDSCSFAPCPVDALLRVEKRYIQRLRPKYNLVSNPAAGLAGGEFGSTIVLRPFVQNSYTVAQAAEYLATTIEQVEAIIDARHLRMRRRGRSRERVLAAIDLHDYATAGERQ